VKFKVLGTILLVFLAAAVVSVIYYWRTDQQVANYYLNNFIEFPIHKEKPIYPTPVDSEQTGTLSGHVEIGPNCPVESLDFPCPPSQDQYDLTEIMVYKMDRTTIVERTNPDHSGNYTLTLPVGSYYATYHRLDNIFQPPMTKITITSDTTTTQNFSIDTGIR